ncbi:hypothetical protein BAZSYMA_ACONTIG08765_3 [Bathymodiolus azoricus thioautotrophic gill symbiont]|uniref:Uncharacterized protein n=1 Tax=Bathymodiolus azoricus thioautotrophic gill symbiont TaxID=235205 RepID=A0A1H6JB47_9GAMM|nr:hypothetical protein BAZSYMA_ACONTIG08765_3 [Bathymodiolus azoricus thioautotrophic gill symbiont]
MVMGFGLIDRGGFDRIDANLQKEVCLTCQLGFVCFFNFYFWIRGINLILV